MFSFTSGSEPIIGTKTSCHWCDCKCPLGQSSRVLCNYPHLGRPIHAIIMDSIESSYDLIIGMDLMQTLGIDIHNSSKMVVWDQLRVLFKPHDYFSSNLFQTALQDQMVGSLDEQDSNEELGYKSKTIKSSLYEQHDPHHVAEQLTHLSTSQRQELAQLLARFPKLFSSKLGCFPNKKVHLELQLGAKPFRC
jgi:hypothetical protein